MIESQLDVAFCRLEHHAFVAEPLRITRPTCQGKPQDEQEQRADAHAGCCCAGDLPLLRETEGSTHSV